MLSPHTVDELTGHVDSELGASAWHDVTRAGVDCVR